MNLLETLARAADEEQLKLHPLPEHAAANQAEHLRQHYALLLAAVLTSQASISEAQTRLLRLLLNSLKLGDIRAQLFEQARALEPAPLLEAARLIREAGFAEHLLVDMLVLLRLDAPLTDEAARLAGELAAFLGLDETVLATRARDAVEILGLDVASKDAAPTEDAPAHSPILISLAQYWPARLRQPLTLEALKAGLQGGLWELNADMVVHFPWQAEDTILFFNNNAILSTLANNGEVKLNNCRLLNAVLNFTGDFSISLEKCEWLGNYNPDLQRTALRTTGQPLDIRNCKFSTNNAQTIFTENNILNITDSQFISCGHPELDGGAIRHSASENSEFFESLMDSGDSRIIENCYFDSNIAARGGAIYFESFHGVHQSEFVNCKSLAFKDKGVNDIAIYSNTNDDNPVLTKCIFRNTSISIGYSYAGSGRTIAKECQFFNGNIFFTDDCNHHFFINSTVANGAAIEKDL